MGMYCVQCQESVKGTGCIARGVCGKNEVTAKLQDTLVYALEGIAFASESSGGKLHPDHGRFISEGLFVTVTNTNFDDEAIAQKIREALALREMLKSSLAVLPDHDCLHWHGNSLEEFVRKAEISGIEALSDNEDIRSLKGLVLYGLKGLAAYNDHADVLGYTDDAIHEFYVTALAALTKELELERVLGLVMETGAIAVKAMALLDKANTETYGHPVATTVRTGVGSNPGILISGHDLKDMEELLLQTEGTGVDVYTHCEMLPAHYYPAFSKYRHFIGNYGGSWWLQDKEFESFNGPILMTTNCIVPVREAYRYRMFTTGNAGYEGLEHIPPRKKDGQKDFSRLIELAKNCPPPKEIENGEIIGGFAHHQVIALADKIVDAVKSGAIRRFIVMGGCDGRHNSRKYYTNVATELPQDTVILTAGCAKFRYNKLPLGSIDGIPRVLDAGQCNDSYSLAMIALTLKDIFGLDDINDLPVSYDIAWYEQKAVAVFLALLALGVKGIRLGPTLPEFLTPNTAAILVEKFNIRQIGTVFEDIEAMMAGN
ncbi:MAG: hydroxylamine reductase [Chlorobiaceae bacterium]|nr:hydroxylamine reductase [Chlorobiaceae bacterium]